MAQRSEKWLRDNAAYLEKLSNLSFQNRPWNKRSLAETRDFLGPWRHNIRLPFGVYTAHVPDHYPSHQVIMRVIDQHLDGGFAGKRIVDIGCLEAYFAAECALQGADVLGIDGKTINIKKCEFVKSALGIKTIRFAEDDAMNVTRRKYGRFDVSLVLGLLYHLDDPFTFLKNMADLTEEFMVLETHVGLPGTPRTLRGGWRPELSGMKRFKRGGRTYEGRTYREFDRGTSQVFKDLSSTASLKNDLSIWLSDESLVDLLHDVGFEATFRYMFPRDREDLWWSDMRRDARVLMVAVRKQRSFRSRIFGKAR